MARRSMPCPFSKEACVECAVYRGRHLYLCAAQSGGRSAEKDLPRSMGTFERSGHHTDAAPETSTELRRKPAWVVNVEDLIEGQELSGLGERGKTDDP